MSLAVIMCPMMLTEPTRAALILIGYYVMLLAIFGGIALVATLAQVLEPGT